MKKIIFSQSKLMVVTILLLSLFSITNSCKKTSDVPGPNEVFIQGMAFNPGTITVAVNTTVTWTNKDGTAHTVTSNTPGLFDSGSISVNGTYPHMFSTVGTFSYKCTIHPSMVGSVVVH
jgi:plastocyanin